MFIKSKMKTFGQLLDFIIDRLKKNKMIVNTSYLSSTDTMELEIVNFEYYIRLRLPNSSIQCPFAYAKGLGGFEFVAAEMVEGFLIDHIFNVA